MNHNRRIAVVSGVRAEAEKSTLPKDRHSCAGTSLLGHQCANLVLRRGDVCVTHRKLAARTRPRWIRPDLRSAGAIVSSGGPTSKVGR